MTRWSALAAEAVEKARRRAASRTPDAAARETRNAMWLALAAAAAFTMSVVIFFVAAFLPPEIGDPMAATARSFIVGSGGILAATTVIALYSALMRQVHLGSEPGPLASMHPRRRG